MSDSEPIVEFQTDIGAIRVRVQPSFTAERFVALAREGKLDGAYEAFTRIPHLSLRPRKQLLGRSPSVPIDRMELRTECPPGSCFLRTDGVICFSFNRSGSEGVVLGKIISDTGVLERLGERKMSVFAPHEFKGFNNSERVKAIRVTEIMTDEGTATSSAAVPQTQRDGQGYRGIAGTASYCSGCGTKLESSMRFCPGCGRARAQA